ncbi:MAG: hypothetical protein AAB293_02895 [Pseudomonadota bacterium]
MAIQPPDHFENKDKPIVSTTLNIGVIIGTIIFPLVGLLMGFSYYRKDHPDAKKAGKIWMILGGIMVALNIYFLMSMRQSGTGPLQ